MKRDHQKIYKNISAKKTWNTLINIEAWPLWHKDLKSCHMKGKFKVGNHFTLTLRNGKSFKTTLTDIDEGKSFTDCTKFPGAKMWDSHSLEQKGEDLLISNSLVVTGPLKSLWSKLVANKVANSIESKTDALIELVRKENS